MSSILYVATQCFLCWTVCEKTIEAMHMQVLLQPLHKAILTLLHVSATDCSHHQGSTILQRHKQRIVRQQMLQRLFEICRLVQTNLIYGHDYTTKLYEYFPKRRNYYTDNKSTNSQDLWDTRRCRLLKRYWRFEGPFFLRNMGNYLQINVVSYPSRLISSSSSLWGP
jgi:hypothetical protein